MFNKKFINFLLYYLAVVFIFLFIISIVAGIILSNQYPAVTAGKVGYFIGYVGSSSALFAFFYSLIAVLYKINNSDSNKTNNQQSNLD